MILQELQLTDRAKRNITYSYNETQDYAQSKKTSYVFNSTSQSTKSSAYKLQEVRSITNTVRLMSLFRMRTQKGRRRFMLALRQG